MISVACLSGGMDSAVLTALAAVECAPDLPAALHVNYGQRTEARELRAFHHICDRFGITRRLVADLSFFRAIGGSSLTDRFLTVPVEPANDASIPSTYVPFRNGVILSVAAAWGESIAARRIYIGAVQTDRTGYPDCRRQFLESMAASIDLGTRSDTHLEVRAPLVNLSKAEIVRKGADLGVPFELTWSCYTHEDLACGKCDSCRLRLEAFTAAGVPDPIPYANRSGS